MNIKIIGITGATGVLGKLLLAKLQEQSYSVSIFEDDIRESAAVSHWVKAAKCDAIFHLAAVVATSTVEQNPFTAFAVNVGGTINLLNAIQTSGTNPWVFYASTCHVYKSKQTPISEADTVEPINLYGQSKYMAEQMCTLYQKQNNTDLCIGRIFSFFHSSQKEPFLYPSIKKRIEAHNIEQPFILEGAKNIRDFLNAEAIIEILIELMQKKVSDTVNIGSGQPTSIKDFVQQNFTKNLNIIYKEHEPSFLVADITKLHSVLK